MARPLEELRVREDRIRFGPDAYACTRGQRGTRASGARRGVSRRGCGGVPSIVPSIVLSIVPSIVPSIVRRAATRYTAAHHPEASQSHLDPSLNSRLHEDMGHLRGARLVETLKHPDTVLPDSIETLDPSAREHAYRALRQYKCPSCARSLPHLKNKNRRRTPFDIKPFEILHLDLQPMGSGKEGGPAEMPLDECVPAANLEEGYVLLAVCQATRYTLCAGVISKNHKNLAYAWFEIDDQIREIQSAALDKDGEFAAAQGYSRERVADRSRSIVPRVFYDSSNEANAFSMALLAPPRQGDPQPYVVQGFDLDRRYETGGAPLRVKADKQRKYENGLVERRHQAVKHRAIAMLAAAGLGFAAYRYAYEYAANTESLLATSIPSNYRAEDGTLKVADSRGIPFNKALGFLYDHKARPLYAFGALAFPRVDTHIPPS